MEHNYLSGKEIADNIRAERSRSKLTQEYVAKELGITTKTYISYEENAQSIKAATLYKLSLILNCNISDFYLQK
jgi:transcriptional regulator with XRE-family HTH domain